MISYKTLLLLFILSLIATLLFVGQFYDHHGDKGLFIKHRPTFRQTFFSAADGTDKQIKPFDSKEKKENDLKEIEEDSGLAVALIQATITLFTFGLISLFKKTNFHLMQLIVQFSINIFITIFCIYFMLFADSLTATVISFGIILTSNFISTLLVTRVNTLNASTETQSAPSDT